MGANKPYKRPTLDIEDVVVREHIEALQENSQLVLVGIDAAPTAGTPLLEDQQWGIYSGSLYIRDGNTISVFTADSSITVT